MSDSALFVLVFGGLFVLRIVAATIVFALLMPQSDRCPDCDAETRAVASPVLDRFLPWFRRSWCLECGWEGVLRRAPVTHKPADVGKSIAVDHRRAHAVVPRSRDSALRDGPA